MPVGRRHPQLDVCLGVLQGLAQIGVLRHIDYLSTVSGGGYTGGWLTTWLHREGPAGRDHVMRELDPAQAAQLGSSGEASPVDRLRSTCRYLAPAGGIVSADVWSLALTMARNLILNWLVILPLLAAILLVPRLYFALVHSLERNITVTGVCGWQDLAGARAFLLTVANARLGLWFGNPQSATGWQRSEPPLGVEPLAREMLGLTTDHNPYVYLSDGGHYENLGLWEMVARRCRFIIISDAGCDPTYSFEDLSNAVRRIRLDLDIPIEFPPMATSREGQGRTNQHGAIGVIKYSAVDGTSAPDGTILYLKATLSGDESVDVRNFAAADPLFPHDSTANQFFDEARFESYRMLGFHTVMSVTGGERGIDSAEALCTLAKKVLEQRAAAAPNTAAV